MKTYECNGHGKHKAIIYASQPCPLCACQEIIEQQAEEIRILEHRLKEAVEKRQRSV